MKKLKFFVFFVLVVAIALLTCSCMDANTLNSYLAALGFGTQQHTCVDANGDTACDVCSAYVAPTACVSHIDNNGDGICDRSGCGASVPIEMTMVTFNNVTKTYDGKPKTISVKRAPAGAKIEYSMENTQTEAGTYEITATITADGYIDCVLTATLKINPKTVNVEWGDNSKTFAADGKEPTLEYTLDGVIEGDEVNVTLDFGGHDFTQQGKVTVTAKLDNPNYKLNAKTKETTIVFGPNVRTVSFETGVSGKDFDPELVVNGEPVEEPKSFQKVGYTFLGWYNGDVLWNFNDPVTEDMTLTAKWELTKYTVTYYLNGGTNSPDNPATFTVAAPTYLSMPTKEGSIFLGWFTDADLRTPAQPLGNVSKDVSLYAKWAEADKYIELVTDKTIDSSNPSIILTETAINGSFTYTFVADIKDFGEDGAVYIGRGKDTVDGSYLKITPTKMIICTNGIEETTEISRTHIREMAGYLLLELTVSNGKMSVQFSTSDGGGASYNDPWSGRNGAIFFDSENVNLSNATFGWYTDAHTSPTWIVGDATVGSPESNSFTALLVENKYKDFLTIGANGLSAKEVLEYFKEACELGLPKYAIWSYRADSASDYDDTVAEFVSFCKEKGVVPVLSTQPSTATVDNTARNEALKASGERYIDFASMAQYTGVLNSAGEYTEHGATVLYSRFMADFPEIVAAKATMRTEKADVIEGVSADLMYPENYVAGDDVTYEADGKTVKLKYGAFEEFRKASKTEVLDSALTMNGNAIKDGKYMIVSAKIDGTLTEDQTILLGHGYMSSTGKWLEINGKYCWGATYQSWSTAHINPTSRKFEHKLTIKNYITIVVTCDTQHSKKVDIFTDGGHATIGVEVNGNAGDIFVTSAGVKLTDVTMSWTCSDYAKDIWVFGDSYLSLGDPARWPTHLRYDDYYTALMVGASGMSAEEGLANLEDAIQYGKPKYIVWLEGMNNGEKNGEKNKGYHQSVARLFEICEEYDIMPIIATIPSCYKEGEPYILHDIKNNAIYNGLDEFEGKTYRIIDWARAVEDYSSDTAWYEGMLHTDYVHPTNLGAKALYMQLINDFPEIMGGTDATVYNQSAESLKDGSSLTIDAPDALQYNKIFTFTADFDGELRGKISIGNDKSVEGSTWIEIDEGMVKAYSNVGGTATEIFSIENSVEVKNLINLRIHVYGESANVSFVSAGEKDTSMGNKVFSFNVSWGSEGDIFASVQGQNFTNASLNWYTF